MGNLKVEKNEKICKNCKYYLEHYIKEETFLLPIGGHCINRELNGRYAKNKFQLHENCSYWERAESLKELRRKCIKEKLERMQKSLEEIEPILKDEE